MTEVVTSREMEGVTAKDVWSVARRIEEYPLYMDQVQEVKMREVDGKVYGDWLVFFNGNELRWTELAVFDDEHFQLSFVQTEGDMAEWRGSFTAKQANGIVVGEYKIEFNLGVPALEAVLHPLGAAAIRSNCSQMLEAMHIQAATMRRPG
ncbi:MAG: SRPBCC family protein [Pseudomonadota bacterium]